MKYNFKNSPYFIHMNTKTSDELRNIWETYQGKCYDIVVCIKHETTEYNNEMRDYYAEIAFRKWCLVYLIIEKLEYTEDFIGNLDLCADSCTYCAIYHGKQIKRCGDCPIDRAGYCCEKPGPSSWEKVDNYIIAENDKDEALEGASNIADICYNDMRERIAK